MSWGARVWLWSLAPWGAAAALVWALRAGGAEWAYVAYAVANVLVIAVGLAAIARAKGEKARARDLAEGTAETLFLIDTELRWVALAILSGPFVYLWGRLFRGRPWVHQKLPSAYVGLSLGYWLSLPALGAWLLVGWLRSL